MADMKISDLPQASTVNDAQQFEVNDGGNSRRVTFGMVRDKIKDDLGKPLTTFTTPNSWNDLPTTYPKTGLIPVLIRRNLSGDADNNGPPGYLGHYYYVQQFFYHDGSVTQLAIPWTTAPIAFRARNSNGAWMAWRRVFDSINGTLPAAKISDSTEVGRNVLTSPTSAGARAAIGAGTSNLALGTTATTAKPGDWKPNIDTDTTGQLPYSRLTDVPNIGDASYTAGDTYVVGRLRDFAQQYGLGGGVGSISTQSLAGELMAASDGTVRIKLTQHGSLSVSRDGTQVASWSTSGTMDRTLNLDVSRGQRITLSTGLGSSNTPNVKNIRFLSATVAPPLIPLPTYPEFIYIPNQSPGNGE